MFAFYENNNSNHFLSNESKQDIDRGNKKGKITVWQFGNGYIYTIAILP